MHRKGQLGRQATSGRDLGAFLSGNWDPLKGAFNRGMKLIGGGGGKDEGD